MAQDTRGEGNMPLLSRSEDHARSKADANAAPGGWWGEPLLQPRVAEVFFTPLHVVSTLLACYFWSAVGFYAWPPRSMFENAQAWLQCTAALAGFHCLAADNARLVRVCHTRRRAALFYGVTNAATMLWALTDALLPKGYFIMLSGPGLRALAPGAWVLLVAVLSLLLASVGLQVREASAERFLTRIRRVFLSDRGERVLSC